MKIQMAALIRLNLLPTAGYGHCIAHTSATSRITAPRIHVAGPCVAHSGGYIMRMRCSVPEATSVPLALFTFTVAPALRVGTY